MKIFNRIRPLTRQKITIKNIAIVTSVALVVSLGAIIFIHLRKPQVALAAACDSSYTLDWSIPSTYTVSCGSVNSSNWTVKGNTCRYTSPTFNAGGNIGDPAKAADISVRINQSGNLDGNDTAWVNMYVNGIAAYTYRCLGDSIAAVFTTSQTIVVPAGGTYSIEIILKNDKSNETWQIKNGNVTACLRTLIPLPITLGEFKGIVNDRGGINLTWTTLSEVNNKNFTIERSVSGVDFEQLGNIDGAGFSTAPLSYEFEDPQPIIGVNYYRLKQTDFDGNTTLFDMIKVITTETTAELNILKVFPVPFKQTLNIQLNSEQEKELLIKLVGMHGKVIHSQVNHVVTGPNTLSCQVEQKILPGNYFVQITGPDGYYESIKVVSK